MDEILRPTIAGQLRSRRHDAIALTEMHDLAGLSDEEVLTLASSADRIVVTCSVRDLVVLDRKCRDDFRHHARIACPEGYAVLQDRAFAESIVQALAKAN